MAEDKLASLDNPDSVTTTEDVSPQAPDVGPARDPETGRFAPKGDDEGKGDAGEPAAAAPPAADQKDDDPKLTTLLDERDRAAEGRFKATLDEREKRQRAELERDQALRRIADLERRFAAASAPEPPAIPDPIEGPQGHDRHPAQ